MKWCLNLKIKNGSCLFLIKLWVWLHGWAQIMMTLALLKCDPAMFTTIFLSPQMHDCYKFGMIVKMHTSAFQWYATRYDQITNNWNYRCYKKVSKLFWRSLFGQSSDLFGLWKKRNDMAWHLRLAIPVDILFRSFLENATSEASAPPHFQRLLSENLG